MAYEPKNWECGEIVTADALNHIEQGIADCCSGGDTEPLVLTTAAEEVPCPSNPSRTTTQYTHNHSWQEIYDALSVGRLVVSPVSHEDSMALMIIVEATSDGDHYEVTDISGAAIQFADANSLVYIASCGK